MDRPELLAKVPILSSLDATGLDVRFSLTIDESRGASTRSGVDTAIIRNLLDQFAEEIPIWENEQFKARPIF